MFKDISDDIAAKIMVYCNIKDLIMYSSINKYNKIILSNNYTIKDSIKSSLKWEFKIKNMNRFK